MSRMLGFVVLLLSWSLVGYVGQSAMGAATSLEGGLNGVLSPLGYEGGGRFTSVALSPANPKIVLVGSDVCGVFKSVDGGESFAPKCEGLQEFAVADMAFSPVDPSQVVLLTDGGVYLSLDEGEHWEKKTSAIHYNGRRLGDRLVVFHKGMVWVATDSAGVFMIKPTDGPWTPEEVMGLSRKKLSSIALHQDDLYVGTMQGVYRLKGGKWVMACDGLDPANIVIENLVGHASGRMYLVEHSTGVYVWDEAMKSWDHRGIGYVRQWMDRPQGFKAIGVHSDNPDIIFLATYPETWPYLVYKSTDAGKSWKLVKEFRMSPDAAETFAKSITDVEEIAFLPQDPSTVFMTDWTNVWRSGNEGETWVQVYKGLQNTVVNDIKVHPSDSSRLFMALSDNGLVASGDSGRTWKRKLAGLPVGDALDIGISAANPQKMYILMRPRKKMDKILIFRSEDGGENWVDVACPLPGGALKKESFVDGEATNLVIDPSSDDVVYAATNGYGVFRSDNGGRNWKAVNKGLHTPYVKGPGALAADPSAPGVLYAATLKGGLFRSEDRGESWRPISEKYSFTYSVALAPGNPTKIHVACAEGKVIMSENLGLTWREARLPGSGSPDVIAHTLAVDPRSPQWIVVGTMAFGFKASDGVFLSRDGGATFLRCRSDMPPVGVNRVLFAPNGKGKQRFLVGLNGAGPYEGIIAEDQ